MSLVGGDLEMGATGTVTHIDGDRVYAFGHPFYNLGPTEFPMTRAYVYTILPSLMSSFKISTLGEMIGTMQQDRATAIAGTLGKGPTLIPMTVTLERDGRADAHAARSTISSSTISCSRRCWPTSRCSTRWARTSASSAPPRSRCKSRAHVKGHGDLAVEDVFTGDSPMLGASTAVAGPLTMLLRTTSSRSTIEGLDLTVDHDREAAQRDDRARLARRSGRAPGARCR